MTTFNLNPIKRIKSLIIKVARTSIIFQVVSWMVNRSIRIFVVINNFASLIISISAVASIVKITISTSKVFADNPRPSQINFQDPATPAMIGIIDLHHEIMFWLTFVVFFVFQILAFEIYFFAYAVEKSLSIKSFSKRYKFTSCSILETIWTILPIYVLWSIASPSLALLYSIEEERNPDLTLKIVGRQWYWNYELMDFIEFATKLTPISIIFDSYLSRKDNIPGFIRLLDVDHAVYFPLRTEVRLLITSDDVIHSWTIPSFGVKLDAIPGRLNTSLIFITRRGIFYGQCSELCGVGHGFMPITSVVTGRLSFIEWILKATELKKYHIASFVENCGESAFEQYLRSKNVEGALGGENYNKTKREGEDASTAAINISALERELLEAGLLREFIAQRNAMQDIALRQVLTHSFIEDTSALYYQGKHEFNRFSDAAGYHPNSSKLLNLQKYRLFACMQMEPEQLVSLIKKQNALIPSLDDLSLVSMVSRARTNSFSLEHELGIVDAYLKFHNTTRQDLINGYEFIKNNSSEIPEGSLDFSRFYLPKKFNWELAMNAFGTTNREMAAGISWPPHPKTKEELATISELLHFRELFIREYDAAGLHGVNESLAALKQIDADLKITAELLKTSKKSLKLWDENRKKPGALFLIILFGWWL